MAGECRPCQDVLRIRKRRAGSAAGEQKVCGGTRTMASDSVAGSDGTGLALS